MWHPQERTLKKVIYELLNTKLNIFRLVGLVRLMFSSLEDQNVRKWQILWTCHWTTFSSHLKLNKNMGRMVRWVQYIQLFTWQWTRINALGHGSVVLLRQRLHLVEIDTRNPYLNECRCRRTWGSLPSWNMITNSQTWSISEWNLSTPFHPRME